MIEKIKRCSNKCIFCFVDQLPKGLRSSLYVKDDDYLESFKHGNFITLTNLSKKDVENIIKYSLSPLYVSFHSADDKIRDIIFKNKNHKKSMDILKILDQNEIKINIQIVLCPKINDGNDLLNTLDFLNHSFNNILSIGIVPVGITGYNKNSTLISFNSEGSKELIEVINNYNRQEHKTRIFLSDEFYILADIEFPEYRFYGNFPQMKNGIGLCRNFIQESDNYLKKNDKEIIFCINNIIKSKQGNYINKGQTRSNDLKYSIKNSILILTSKYFFKTMNYQTDKLSYFIKTNKLNINLNLKVKDVKNYFLGGNVKVAGLLTYYDFIRAFNNKTDINKKEFGSYDKILIPNIIFNNDGLTLDNKTKKDFENISENIKFIDPDGKTFLREILGL
ncbi:MAG: DUF512 domain-containing protein [Actinobacteria bacterium]|nr:DUF512 domain-containing protein [Actinomycetota bacterium]